MKRFLSKKWTWVLVFVLVGGIIFGSHAVVSAAERKEAENTARGQVPVDAVLETSERDDGMYQFQFYSESEGMEYEVEISEKSGEVRKVETELRGGTGSKSVALSEDQIRALVEERYPGAEISSLQLGMDDGYYSYEVYFRADGKYGTLEFNAETGAVLESKVKFGNPIVIPSEEGSTSAETSFLKEADIRSKVEEAYPGSQITMLEMDREDGQYVYEVEFLHEGKKYELTYNALNGEILKQESEVTNWAPSSTAASTETSSTDAAAQPSQSAGQQTTPVSGQEIGSEKAKEIALGKAEAANASITKMELEREHGSLVYDGHMRDDSYKYEFEIDAYTGVVLKWEKETRNQNAGTQPTASDGASTISKEEASSIALSKAQDSGAEIVSIRKHHDDDHLIYEGHMRDQSCKYEFEIDAYTGTVLDWDVEHCGNHGSETQGSGNQTESSNTHHDEWDDHDDDYDHDDHNDHDDHDDDHDDHDDHHDD